MIHKCYEILHPYKVLKMCQQEYLFIDKSDSKLKLSYMGTHHISSVNKSFQLTLLINTHKTHKIDLIIENCVQRIIVSCQRRVVVSIYESLWSTFSSGNL